MATVTIPAVDLRRAVKWAAPALGYHRGVVGTDGGAVNGGQLDVAA